MTRATPWMQRHQVLLYLGALALGAAFGMLVPAAARPLELAITPVLALLLYATFLGVPFAEIGRAVRDRRFLTTILIVNFACAPAVAFVLSRFVAGDTAVLVGVLLVLLTPCVDYVIAFTGLAGGSRARLLAATPLLMLAQMALLPLYLWLMVDDTFAASLDLRPFAWAFVLLIVLPLGAAVATQVLARRAPWAKRVDAAVTAAMVPLMIATLAIVVASQVHAVAGSWAVLIALVPLYAAFAAIMAGVGAAAGRVARLDGPGRTAVIFSGVTRNSLVVLPLALALPAGFALTPLVVVTQTLVELLAMVTMVSVATRRAGAGALGPQSLSPR
jgi:ACR3 family arsenite transporter